MNITKEEAKKYKKPKWFQENYGILPCSMRNYAEKNYIRYIRTAGDHRKYHIDDIGKLLSIIKPTNQSSELTREERNLYYIFNNEDTQSEVICYSRITNELEKHRLEQERNLFKTNVPFCQIIQEIGNPDDLERRVATSNIKLDNS